MKVLVVMGSDSDFPIVEKALVQIKSFDVAYECRVFSAHRTPYEALECAAEAEKNGFEVIIAAAGKAAALPGVLASATTLPVIGLPIKTSALGGMDSLFSIVQMPSGVPVATVALDGGTNAGLLAVQILAVKYPALREKMKEYKATMKEKVLEKDSIIQKR